MENIIEINQKKLGGTPCFNGTRVPIRNLFDYLEEGESIEDFLEDFPPISFQQVESVLELAKQSLLSQYHENLDRPLSPREKIST